MNIKLKYISKDPLTNSVVVRYYTDLVSEESLQRTTDYSVSLPIPTPNAADLYAYLIARAPAEYLAMKEHLLTNEVDMSHIELDCELILDPSQVPTNLPPAIPRAEEIRRELYMLDMQKIRPIADNDTTYLRTLNAKTKLLRDELSSIL
jgi:hypothetical protein